MGFIEKFLDSIDDFFSNEEPVDPEVQKKVNMICKDIRILCKAVGNYERGQETIHGCGYTRVEDMYRGSFDYGAYLWDGIPGAGIAYFDHRMHCIGPYWDKERCLFYVDMDGKIVKYEDGEWVKVIHKAALRWRELLKGPGHFMSESSIDSL